MRRSLQIRLIPQRSLLVFCIVYIIPPAARYFLSETDS